MVCRKQAIISTINEQLGHPSFHRIKILSRSGIIPKELTNVDAPSCPGCAYGKAHHKPIQIKGVKNKKQVITATTTGQVVSIDKLFNPTPGFIPTDKGIPTTQRYIGATVFVDHLSEFTYIHPMKKLDVG